MLFQAVTDLGVETRRLQRFKHLFVQITSRLRKTRHIAIVGRMIRFSPFAALRLRVRPVWFRFIRVRYRAAAIFCVSVDFANFLFLLKIFFICDKITENWAMMEMAAASRVRYVFLH